MKEEEEEEEEEGGEEDLEGSHIRKSKRKNILCSGGLGRLISYIG
jgi:hypothetical protein